MTSTCPNCKRDHALFYWVSKSGKRTVCMTCDRIEKTTITGQIHYSTGRIETAETRQDLPLPEKWSSGYAKKNQQTKELQLILMHNHENDQDGRGTSVPAKTETGQADQD